jgi:hypothetical protein
MKKFKKLPLGVQTFAQIINEDYLYVDKTKHIYNLFAKGGKYYFLSRPRRFGKSLLISTLKELFSGNKQLFKGLWIEDKIAWNCHPVIHIDFSHLSYQSADVLRKSLDQIIQRIARDFNEELAFDTDTKMKFAELVRKLSQRNQVVILVDEYDKPIIDLIDNPKMATENRDVLRDFYSLFKGLDEYLKFVFLTGVSKFSKASVFSGLNNLNDITMDDLYAMLLGYTESELQHYFRDQVLDFAKNLKIDKDKLLENIKKWYNGYSWNGKDFVYNPFSIISFFEKRIFDNYWFSSGTPTFLIKQLKKNCFPVREYEYYETDKSIFESFEINRINIPSLLFQTGYLTVKHMQSISLTNSMYYLSYPNNEVRESFFKHVLAAISEKFPNEIGSMAYQFINF